MQEYDEVSSYRSMNFRTDSPAQFAVPETVHPACIRNGKILASRLWPPKCRLPSATVSWDVCLKDSGHGLRCP